MAKSIWCCNWQTSSIRTPKSGRRVFALSVVVLTLSLIPLPLTSQAANQPSGVEVIAYFRTALPPNQGESVCLTGGAKPIGTIRSVRLLPHHDEYHDAWEAIMEINKDDALAITADSIAQANPFETCGILINVTGTGPPIAYHTVLKGEVSYSAEIGYMIPPKHWWQPAVDFLAMDIGIIWVEVVGGPILVVGAIMILITCAHRKRPNSQNKS